MQQYPNLFPEVPQSKPERPIVLIVSAMLSIISGVALVFAWVLYHFFENKEDVSGLAHLPSALLEMAALPVFLISVVVWLVSLNSYNKNKSKIVPVVVAPADNTTSQQTDASGLKRVFYVLLYVNAMLWMVNVVPPLLFGQGIVAFAFQSPLFVPGGMLMFSILNAANVAVFIAGIVIYKRIRQSYPNASFRSSGYSGLSLWFALYLFLSISPVVVNIFRKITFGVLGMAPL